MADYGTIKVNKVTYKNGSDSDTDFNFKTDIVSSVSPDFTTDITLKSQAPVKFEDDSGGEFVGLKAPTGVTSYTVTLPATAPSSGKVLKATSATALEWGTDATDVAAANLTGNTLASGVVTSSLTAVGTVATGTWGATDVAVAHGGTGASDASTARTNLGVAIGSDVQAFDADTAKKDVDQEFTKPQRGDVTVATHSSGATYDFDLDASNNFKLTISAAVALGFSNLDASREGQTGVIYIDNGAITPTWGAEVQFEGGTTLSITQSVKSVLAYYVIPGGAKVLVTGILDVTDD